MMDDIIITLDDNQKYVVVSKVSYEDATYLYLANIDTITDFIIGRLEVDEIKVIQDETLLNHLLVKFSEAMKEEN